MCDGTRVGTGLGDRLLQVWAAALFARLQNGTLLSQWRCNGARRDAGRAYDRRLHVHDPAVALTGATAFRPADGCTQTVVFGHSGDAPPRNALPLAPPEGRPARVASALAGLLLSVKGPWPPVPLFVAIARATHLAPALARLAPPARLGGCVCVHLRATDRVGATPEDPDAGQWARLRDRSLLYLRRRAPPCVFVAGDDDALVAAYGGEVDAMQLLRAPGNATTSLRLRLPPPPRRAAAVLRGLGPAVDLARLAACGEVVSVARFSAFALSSALSGAGVLTAFAEGGGPGAHGFREWDGVLVRLSVVPEGGEAAAAEAAAAAAAGG